MSEVRPIEERRCESRIGDRKQMKAVHVCFGYLYVILWMIGRWLVSWDHVGGKKGYAGYADNQT